MFRYGWFGVFLLAVVASSPARQTQAPKPQPPMAFSDEPNFTVAGVTDWTAAGGHGSDSILRTSEDLARETLKLKGREPVPDTGGARSEADAHRQAGDRDEEAGDPLGAVRQYERATRLDPSERNYFAWGSELLRHRAIWQASDVFKAGAKAYPQSARMLAGLGAALFAGDLYDEAALRFCEASDLEPADTQPYLVLGKVLLAAPHPLPCVASRLARFLQRQPGNATAHYLYAMALWKEQGAAADLSRVKSLLTEAVALDPHCADAYLQLGILYGPEQRYRPAIAAYKQAIAANPQLAEAHYRLGVAYDRAGQREAAKRELALHDELEKQEAAAVERQRREVKQFAIVPKDKANTP